MSLLRRQGNGNAPPPGSSGNAAAPTTSPTATTTSISSMTSSSSAPSPTSSDTSGSQNGGSHDATLIIIIASILAILTLAFTWYFLRRVRARHKNPKYIPTQYLKRLWTKWDVDPARYRLPDSDHEGLEPQRTASEPSAGTTSEAGLGTSRQRASNSATPGATVDRNSSVRSIMTLPAYNLDARPNEQVIGREGERDNMDVVIEFPETVDEEEERRNEEMEALYQVRLARRRENEEREERRRLRAEARERGDFVALREINHRARAESAASTDQTLQQLRDEHDRLKKERQRAVPSVSYADLGVAQHNGTRIRANSHESESTGLLGDAASIADSSNYHRRNRSSNSVLSIDSDFPSPGLTRTRSRANSRPESPLWISLNTERPGTSNTGRAGSSPEMIDHEDADVPSNSPPEYETISLENPSDSNRPRPRLSTEPPPEYYSPVVGIGGEPTFPNQPKSEQTVSSNANPGEDAQRRRSHVGQLISESREHSAGSAGSRSSRGVGGVPQLPSLRLGSLPSIQVDPGTPIARQETVREE